MFLCRKQSKIQDGRLGTEGPDCVGLSPAKKPVYKSYAFKLLPNTHKSNIASTTQSSN